MNDIETTIFIFGILSIFIGIPTFFLCNCCNENKNKNKNEYHKINDKINDIMKV